MDYRFAVIAVFLALSGSVHAGYTQLTPPDGWTNGSTGGNSVGTLRYGKEAANVGQWTGRTVVTDSSLNVGGRAVKVPAALRLASNAPRFAAGVLFGNPLLRLGLWGAAFLAAEFIWDEASQTWRKVQDAQLPVDGRYWQSSYGSGSLPWRNSPDEACVDGIDFYNANSATQRYTFTRSSGTGQNRDCWGNREALISGEWKDFGESILGYARSKVATGEACPAGWTETPAGCLSPAVTQPEFVDEVGNNLMPDKLPQEWPELPWPFELPKINPGPSPDFNPRPFFVPQGDPVPNPNYDPNAEPSPENLPYVRPGLNVKPANNDKNPWNVDIQPVDKPSPDDVSNPDPDMNPDPQGDKDKKPQDVGLCDMYPDIVACAKLGQVSEVPVKNRTVPLSIQREEGFGPSEGSCPAPSEFVIMGRSMSFRWDLFCEFATGIRPVVVGMAYLLAVLAFFGLSRKGS